MKKTTVRTLIAIAGIGVIAVLMWLELAVGVFGTPWAGS